MALDIWSRRPGGTAHGSDVTAQAVYVKSVKCREDRSHGSDATAPAVCVQSVNSEGRHHQDAELETQLGRRGA